MGAVKDTRENSRLGRQIEIYSSYRDEFENYRTRTNFQRGQQHHHLQITIFNVLKPFARYTIAMDLEECSVYRGEWKDNWVTTL